MIRKGDGLREREERRKEARDIAVLFLKGRNEKAVAMTGIFLTRVTRK